MSTNNYEVIGMIHLPGLLGKADYPGFDKLLDATKRDLEALQEGEIDAIMLENDNDKPYSVFIDTPEAISMAILMERVKSYISIPFGYTLLLNDWKAALSLAVLTDASFIRLDTFVDKVQRVDDEIIIDPDTNAINEFKKKVSAEKVEIYTDVHVKHTKMLDETKTIEQSIDDAIKHESDGIVISGNWTGDEPNLEELKKSYTHINNRVATIVGSGFSEKNAEQLMKYSDKVIVGSSIKTGTDVDQAKVRELMNVVNSNR